ncbi:MAG: hypothetical protein HOE30_06555 [Deltaproteobacteria bacterium]|jgi:hypothetical protein|nr:hypothetical protein [Deltaproteobacteria bacterium]MBT4267897.1 hypothetical protein [Deltaproteobacteria bacterium]MBT4642194.1 hypothetical protein [Deltaproteobacteria bacterium]MBT6499355.1 hypothetical protein [Deltaproteobacteria bacterium]MBT6615912.1 hypothetical protein [Deltaproteobacteria bacterium]
MPHIEHINFRCLDHEIEQIISAYITPLINEAEVQQNWDVKIFQHYHVPSDLLMTITSKIEMPDLAKSEFGIQIAENLKFFGAVSHLVWNQLSS